MYRILICDDEKDIVSALKIYLTGEDYDLLTAYDGDEAVRIVKEEDVHLVLMDIMMPKKDGLNAMEEIRRFSNVPILLLTAKSEDSDKVLGLHLGADDYITKPFQPMEVLARVRSQLRRYVRLGGIPQTESRIVIGGVELDDDSKLVTVDGEPVTLTPLEYDILRFLMRNAGKVFSSRQLYAEVWHETAFGADNTVAVHIRHLREKIEIDPSVPRYLKVVWGQGYKFEKKENL